jgi:hypothetical protein
MSFPGLECRQTTLRLIHGGSSSSIIWAVHGIEKHDNSRAKKMLDEKGKVMRWWNDIADR